MRRPLLPLARGPGLLAILVAILFISVVYSASVRRAFLMSDLQFIPVEDELLLVTGDMESLWEGVDHHFGAVFLDETERTPGPSPRRSGNCARHEDEEYRGHQSRRSGPTTGSIPTEACC